MTAGSKESFSCWSITLLDPESPGMYNFSDANGEPSGAFGVAVPVVVADVGPDST